MPHILDLPKLEQITGTVKPGDFHSPSYVAGMIDYGGSLYGRQSRQQVVLQVRNKQASDLKAFAALFGGSVSTAGAYAGGYVWRVTKAADVRRILRMTYPFLRVKNVQAAYVLRFLAMCDKYPRDPWADERAAAFESVMQMNQASEQLEVDSI